MGEVVIRAAGSATSAVFEDVAGVRVSAVVVSKPLIQGGALCLWQHTLPVGTRMQFEAPLASHTVFVSEGSLYTNGRHRLGRSHVVVIEHGANFEMLCEQEAAQVLHFFAADSSSEQALAGGTVHLLDEHGFFMRAVHVTNLARYCGPTRAVPPAASGCINRLLRHRCRESVYTTTRKMKSSMCCVVNCCSAAGRSVRVPAWPLLAIHGIASP